MTRKGIDQYHYLYGMGTYSIGQALEFFLSKSRIKGAIQAIRIEEVWEQIMGQAIARYTEKIQIHGNTLYITTKIAPLKQELVYQKDLIILRVNERLGADTIKEVVLL